MSTKSVLDLFRLDGRRALVTGGAKGLGRVIAASLAQVGADVALVSRTAAECEATAAAIAAETGRRAVALATDVSKADDVERLVDRAHEALGPIDILVNSAGVNIRGSIDDLKEEDWDAVVGVNLK